MNKNLNKLIALVISVSIIYSNLTPAYGAESTKVLKTNTESIAALDKNQAKPLLKVDTVVERAIENSEKLALKSKEISMYKKKINTQESLNDEISNASLTADYSEYFLETTGDYYIDTYEINRNAAKQDKEFMKDSIERDIKTKYNDIVLMEIQISKLKREIEIKNNQLNFSNVNAQTGYGTETQKMAAEIALKDLKNQLSLKENLLKNKKDYLGVLTDLDLDKYNLDYTLFYDTIDINEDIDSYLNDKLDKYLQYKEQLLDASSDYVEDLDDNLDDSPKEVNPPSINMNMIANIIDPTTGNIDPAKAAALVNRTLEGYKEYKEYTQELNSYLKYLDIDYEVASNKVELNDSRKLMKSKLDEAYSSLKDLENQIDLMNDQFAYVNKNLSFAKVQYEVGMMTLTDYNDKVVQSEDLEIGLRQLINGYNTLKDTIEKPWCSIGS